MRSHTDIGRGATSVPHASVELARERLGTLRGATVLLIGTGSAAELAARHLAKHGIRELLVLGRDRARTARLAGRHGGRVVAPDRLADALAQSDAIISSTAAPGAVVHLDQVKRALVRRRGPLLVIDIAVPRDVDPAVAGLAGVEVFTLDELRQFVERTCAQRSAELPAAYSVVRAEVARFTRWLSRRDLTSVAIGS